MTDLYPHPTPTHLGASPHLPALEQAYRNWSRSKGGNVGEILAMFDDDVEMRSVLSPDVPDRIAGYRSNKEQAAEYFAELMITWEMLYYDIERFIANGDDIAMVGRCGWRKRDTGATVDTLKVDIWKFRNGKVVQFTEVFDSLAFARAVGVA